MTASCAMDNRKIPLMLELGTHSLSSWSQSLISGGLLAASLGRAAVSVEVGSVAHTVVLVGLLISFVVMFSHLLLSKSVSAISAPCPQIVFCYRFLRLVLRNKPVPLHNIAWVRARFDGYQEIFVEAGTRGFETTEILRVPYNNGLGLTDAEEKAAQLAALWSVENKGFPFAA